MPTKLLRPNVGIYVAPSNAFVDYKSPTLAEITALTVFNISPAITDGYTLNMTDSDVDSSLSMTDSATVSTPTMYNYEASLDGFRDASSSATSPFNKFRDLFQTAAVGTKYYLVKRIGKAHNAAFAVGDLVSVYGVTTDYAVDIVADGAMIMTGARFLTTGEVAVNVAVTAGTAAAGPVLAATTGVKIQSNGNLAVNWVPLASITNEATFLSAPTAALINGGTVLTSAIAWDGYELSSTDSNKIDDKSIVDTANAQNRGFSQFSASLTFFRGITAESTGAYYDAFTLFKAATNARPNGYLVVRVGAGNGVFAATNKVNIFKFTADAIGDNTEGEDSVKFTVKFQPQGLLAVAVAVV